jgi:hypothetical protein
MIKAGLKKLRFVTLGFLILLLTLFPVSSVFAVGLGHGFYGTVKINGVNADIGTAISAQVDGTEYGSCTITTPGSYALIVEGEIDEGATIYFYVDGQEADQTSTFHDGYTTKLDLTVTTTPPTYELTMAANPEAGGTAIDLTDESPYQADTVVSIRAEANEGYRFVNWTAPAGTFGNATAAETTFTMPAQNVTVTANFVMVYNLTMAVAPGGSGTATDLTSASPYTAGTGVNIKAVAVAGYRFVNWTAPAGAFGNATAAETTFTMPAQNATVTANFALIPPPPVYPTVTTQDATGVGTGSANLNMNYTVGDFSPVEVCFAYKKSTDSAWSYTDWVSKSGSGTHAAPLAGLTSNIKYDFKGLLKYDGTVIEGNILQFTTAIKRGCFIATAAYGTPTAKQIDVLREFRDVVLLKSAVGSQFVALYYQFSPPIANFIAGHEFVRTLVRELLIDPIVWVVQTTGGIWGN